MTNNNLVYSYRELRELKDILERLEDKHNTMVSSLEKNNNIINVVRETNEINKCILNVMREIKDEKTRKYIEFL